MKYILTIGIIFISLSGMSISAHNISSDIYSLPVQYQQTSSCVYSDDGGTTKYIDVLDENGDVVKINIGSWNAVGVALQDSPLTIEDLQEGNSCAVYELATVDLTAIVEDGYMPGLIVDDSYYGFDKLDEDWNNQILVAFPHRAGVENGILVYDLSSFTDAFYLQLDEKLENGYIISTIGTADYAYHEAGSLEDDSFYWNAVMGMMDMSDGTIYKLEGTQNILSEYPDEMSFSIDDNQDYLVGEVPSGLEISGIVIIAGIGIAIIAGGIIIFIRRK